MANKKEFIKVRTPEARASFPALFEAKKVNEGDKKAKFSIQLLFRVEATPESTKAGEPIVNINELQEAVRRCITNEFGPDRAKWPQFGDGSAGTLKLPFRSGEEPTKKDQPGYGKGIVFLQATTETKPGVVGPDLNPLSLPTELYGGCYVKATVNAYYWKYMGKQGVSFGLQNVQKVRDGEPFGNRTSADKDFDAIPQPGGATPVAAGAAAPAGGGLGV